MYILGDFTFLVNLLLRLRLNPKFGLKPKISQKWGHFFFGVDCRWVQTEWSAETTLSSTAETTLSSKLIWTHQLIMHVWVRLTRYRLCRTKTTSLFAYVQIQTKANECGNNICYIPHPYGEKNRMTVFKNILSFSWLSLNILLYKVRIVLMPLNKCNSKHSWVRYLSISLRSAKLINLSFGRPKMGSD